MKKLTNLLVLLACFFISISAHEVNNYRFLCIDIDENPYGIEKRFNEEFMKAGFQTINHDFYDELGPLEKSQTLFLEYDYYLNFNGPSTISIVLTNSGGIPIWKAQGQGLTLLSARGDMKGATKQIMKQFSKLKYKFNENSSNIESFDNPFIHWTEDSVKTYLKNHRISPIEGIYKNYSNDGNAYNIAIIKDNDRYIGIIVEADNELWRKGETKIILRHIEGGAYDAEYYDGSRQKLNAIAGLKDNRLLEFSAPINGNVMNFSFLKVFPSGNEISTSTISTSKGQHKATGSGVLIADKVIITNYHVIENSDALEAIINVNGIPETFSAHVLCSDKTNDLAIITIKDDKFKGQGRVPFKIVPNTIDVGTSVFAMGFPLSSFLGDEVKITDGIISSKTGYDGDMVTYQISVPIQPGNSGGPLFDKKGNLVGITNAGIDKSLADNVGYAIKSPYILNIIDSAPINIPLPEGENLSNKDLPELIKILKPFVVYIKVY